MIIVLKLLFFFMGIVTLFPPYIFIHDAVKYKNFDFCEVFLTSMFLFVSSLCWYMEYVFN